MNAKQLDFKVSFSELKPFVLKLTLILSGSFLLWLLLDRVALQALTVSRDARGFIALAVSLLAATLAAYLSIRGEPLRSWLARDKRAKGRLGLALVLSWSGALLAYYFLAMSQDLNTTASTLIIILALWVGNLLLIVMDWEITIYIFFGVLTTLVSYGSFALADRIMNGPNLGQVVEQGWQSGLSWLIPQAISFTCAMLFAYPMNRIFVFESQGPVLREFISFVSSRLIMTLIFEVAVFWLFHNLFGINRDLTKILTALLVTIANYIVSKLFIFTETR